ncbi:MAG TPA: hypothetical protein VMI06_09575 [Terriglobia bacterium]|nr:hypothetical protein [Terriglobia bacterium]
MDVRRTLKSRSLVSEDRSSCYDSNPRMRERDELGSSLVNPDLQRQYREIDNFPMSVGFRTIHAERFLSKYLSIRQVRMYQATLEFRQVDDVVDYYATMPMYQQAFEDGEKRSELLRAVRSRIASSWGSAPIFIVNNSYGAYVAQKLS